MDELSGQEKKSETEEKEARLKTAEEINAQIQNPEHGFHAEFKEGEGWDIRFGGLKLNTWYGTLIILGIVLAVFILFSELGK